MQSPFDRGDLQCVQLPNAVCPSHAPLRHQVVPRFDAPAPSDDARAPTPPASAARHPRALHDNPGRPNGDGRERGPVTPAHQGPHQEPHAAQGPQRPHGRSQERRGLLFRTLCCRLDHFGHHHLRNSPRHRTQIHRRMNQQYFLYISSVMKPTCQPSQSLGMGIGPFFGLQLLLVLLVLFQIPLLTKNICDASQETFYF